MFDLVTSFGVAVGLNLVMFIPAYFFKTDKLTDLSYGISFALVALIAFFMNDFNPFKSLLLVMVLLWSVRIGSFLFVRIRKMKQDKRFDGIRESFFKFLGFWLIQGFTVWVVLLPSTLFFSKETVVFTVLSVVGLLVWLAGFAIETVADLQKYRFANDPQNKDRWIDTGLWHYSRHPNYFGEITHWLGIYLFTVSSLTGSFVAVGFLSPLYIALLIIFFSGIPKLEAYADSKWGDSPDYQVYKKDTSILIPLPKKSRTYNLKQEKPID